MLTSRFSSMENPWTAIPVEPDYVLGIDKPYVDAWNQVRGANRERIRLRLDALPEPCNGPGDASLVVLGRNPGWSGDEPRDHAGPLGDALRGNLGDNPMGHVQAAMLD